MSTEKREDVLAEEYAIPWKIHRAMGEIFITDSAGDCVALLAREDEVCAKLIMESVNARALLPDGDES